VLRGPMKKVTSLDGEPPQKAGPALPGTGQLRT
jgi:hypothetical protein